MLEWLSKKTIRLRYNIVLKRGFLLEYVTKNAFAIADFTHFAAMAGNAPQLFKFDVDQIDLRQTPNSI